MNKDFFTESQLSKSLINAGNSYISFNSLNFKEYKNLGGYYLKLALENKELSILAKEIEFFQQKEYEMKMNLNDFYSKNDIFKKYHNLEQILEMIIELIDGKNYKIKKNEENLDFCLIIKEDSAPKDEFSFLLFEENDAAPHEENNSTNEIIFKLACKDNGINNINSNKKDNNSEYINSLLNEIKKLQNTISDLKDENTTIKYDLLKIKEKNSNTNDLKEENLKIKNELTRLKEENKIIPVLKDQNFEFKNKIMQLKEENNNINDLKIENIRIRNDWIKLKEENKIINELKEEIIKYKSELNKLSNINPISTTPKNEENKNIKICLNCSECPLMPEIKLDNFGIPNIESKCPSGHKEKELNLINYLKKSKKYGKENNKCNCKEENNDLNNKKDLYYCNQCNSFICNKCWSEHNSNYPSHKLIIQDLINDTCIEHKNKFISYCKDCGINICNDCIKDHKGHSMEELDLMILSDEEFSSLIKKKENAINHLKKVQNSLDSYKIEWSTQIDILKNYFEIEINLFEEIVNQYSNCKNNYQNIKNLRNIHKFSFDDALLSQNEETIFTKTEMILNILNKIRNQEIIENPKSTIKPEILKPKNNSSNITLVQAIQLDKSVKSICYLKKYNLIALGGPKKIELYDIDFNYISRYNSLSSIVTYLNEFKDDKLLALSNNHKIEILKLGNNNEIKSFLGIELAYEDYFIVGIEIEKGDIILGGRKCLSILGYSDDITCYFPKKQIDLNGSISHLIELDSYTFLIGQCEQEKILIYSNSNYEKIVGISLPLYGSSYSISKISDEFVAIGGEHLNHAFVFIYSIDKREIFQYFKYEIMKCCNTISKINGDRYIISLKNNIDKFDLYLFNFKKDSKGLEINRIGFYIDAMDNNIESMIAFNGYVLTFDSEGKLKIWKIK